MAPSINFDFERREDCYVPKMAYRCWMLQHSRHRHPNLRRIRRRGSLPLAAAGGGTCRGRDASDLRRPGLPKTRRRDVCRCCRLPHSRGATSRMTAVAKIASCSNSSSSRETPRSRCISQQAKQKQTSRVGSRLPALLLSLVSRFQNSSSM